MLVIVRHPGYLLLIVIHKNFLQEASQRVYFGRDPLGRRSLLIHRRSDQKPYFIVTSVSAGASSMYDFEEIDTEHIHYVDLNEWSAGVSQLP